MKKVETFLEFPPESMDRPIFRRLIKHLESFKDAKKFYLGNEGRKLKFAFENEEKRDAFLKEVEQMFKSRMVETVKKEQ